MLAMGYFQNNYFYSFNEFYYNAFTLALKKDRHA